MHANLTTIFTSIKKETALFVYSTTTLAKFQLNSDLSTPTSSKVARQKTFLYSVG